jgi:hypothetical protein
VYLISGFGSNLFINPCASNCLSEIRPDVALHNVCHVLGFLHPWNMDAANVTCRDMLHTYAYVDQFSCALWTRFRFVDYTREAWPEGLLGNR